jgi:hypothetical protein
VGVVLWLGSRAGCFGLLISRTGSDSELPRSDGLPTDPWKSTIDNDFNTPVGRASDRCSEEIKNHELAAWPYPAT